MCKKFSGTVHFFLTVKSRISPHHSSTTTHRSGKNEYGRGRYTCMILSFINIFFLWRFVVLLACFWLFRGSRIFPGVFVGWWWMVLLSFVMLLSTVRCNDTNQSICFRCSDEFQVREDLMGLAIGAHGANIQYARKLDGISNIELEENSCTFKISGEVSLN